MLVDERLRHIVEMMAEAGQVEADAIAVVLCVSRETVRRDLIELERQGRLKRVHGGAVRVEAPPEPSFDTRLTVQIEAKRKIARAALALVKPGSSCFLDAGTTTTVFASELSTISDLYVVTNSLEAAMILRASPNRIDVLLLGGRVSREVPATHGEMTIEEIGRHRVDVAILSPVGLDPSAGMTYHALSEAATAQSMIRNASEILVLADQTKLGQVSRTIACPCAKIGALVSDAEGRALASYRRAGIHNVISAS